MEERLQKLISAAGVCSRRRAEEYIQAGRVIVNGVRAELGMKADLFSDRVEVIVTVSLASLQSAFLGLGALLTEFHGRQDFHCYSLTACPAPLYSFPPLAYGVNGTT